MTVQPPQHMRALADAQHTRLTNAATCRRIGALGQHAGREEAARLLEEDESVEFERMKVEALVKAVHRFGPSTVQMVFKEIGVAKADKRVGELTPRQRVELAGLLRRTVGPSWSKERAA